MKRRKPFAVYVLLQGGDAWLFGAYQGIVEAWGIARTLRGDLPLIPWKRVWIAGVDAPAHISHGRFRRGNGSLQVPA